MADDSLIPVAVPYLKLVAGFAGAVVSLAFLKDQSRWQNLLNVAGGCASAIFLAPAIVDWAGLKSEGWVNATTFLTGMLSMSFLAGVFVIAKAWRENPGNAAAAIADILGKFRGAK
jgi:predicted permease